MAAFVIITPFIGQFLVFLIFPVLVLPYFEDKFEGSPAASAAAPWPDSCCFTAMVRRSNPWWWSSRTQTAHF
jgi:hypothetical protein